MTQVITCQHVVSYNQFILPNLGQIHTKSLTCSARTGIQDTIDSTSVTRFAAPAYLTLTRVLQGLPLMASTSSLSQIAYQKIRQRLFASDFHAEDRISETVLASQLGISRTPVREAIRRLQNEGLLHQIPRKGTFVVQPDRDELIETYDVRRALECMAARKAGETDVARRMCKAAVAL